MRLHKTGLACCLVYVNSEDMIVVTIPFSPVPPCVLCKTGPLIPTSGIPKDRCELSVCVPYVFPLVDLFLCLFFHPAPLALGPSQPGHLSSHPLQTVRCATHPTPLAPRQLRIVFFCCHCRCFLLAIKRK